jgi:hypothetical protein
MTPWANRTKKFPDAPKTKEKNVTKRVQVVAWACFFTIGSLKLHAAGYHEECFLFAAGWEYGYLRFRYRSSPSFRFRKKEQP